jgi:hypothetical protein
MMLRRILTTIFVFLLLFLFVNSNLALAQTPVTCDLCGLCTGQDKSAVQNWDSCAQCLYGTDNPNDTLSGVAAPLDDQTFTVFGCVKTNAGGFTNFFMNFLSSIVGGLGFLGIIYGAVKVMLARGDKDAIREGKRYVYGSILGILVVLFSVFIVRTIGVTILNVPGFL